MSAYTSALHIDRLLSALGNGVRCIIIKLRRPAYSPGWEEDTRRFVAENRWAILGDLVAALKAEPKPIGPVGRWGLWERDVLSRVADPVTCQHLIRGRQADVDEDKEEADRTRSAFEDVIRANGRDPWAGAFRFDSPAVVEVVSRAKCERQTAPRPAGS
jgi:hypothetical protein